MNKTRLITCILFASVSLFGCSSVDKVSQEEKPQVENPEQTVETDKDEKVPQEEKPQAEDPEQTVDTDLDESNTLVYENNQYGFHFSLLDSWKGYSILTETWEGIGIDGSQSGKIVETGPMIIIRHPQWTEQNQRQDIPIMVFTLTQWESMQQEQFHIGAAPIGPKELGRNSSYVFALPARYNYAFLTGFEEVEDILNNHALQPFEISAVPSS
jgi:hypothetical protein